MIVDPTTRIILSTQRYQQAPRSDQFLNIPLAQTTKNLVEFDRVADLNLAQVFDQERQESTTFRPVTKFTILFENAFTGSTTYPPFRDNLYYTNALNNAKIAYPSGISTTANNSNVPPNPFNANVPWDGFPQYPEFDFIRTDNNVPGYTIPPQNHILFKDVSATTYNWTHYISYPFENVYNRTLFAVDPNTSFTWSWVASNGLPFIILNGTNAQLREISFKCPMAHGLSVGEFVQLSISYGNQNNFQVISLGDSGSGSEEYIFNILNVGYTGTTFQQFTQGTFKRIINLANSGDTISSYYIRRHKILTTSESSVLANAGFEYNIYGDKTKCEVKPLTPNQKARTSVKEGARSYTLSFNSDIDIRGLQDNQRRPLSSLFFTTIWRGYLGWTSNMKQGWYFNTYLQNNKPQTWWDQSNTNSNTNIPQSFYTTTLGGAKKFYYNELLTTGDTMDGDYCEWNNYEQLERVISTYQHKIKYNQNWFSTSANTATITNQYGYFYQPHNPIQISAFSDYVEEGSGVNVVGIPDYAYYSTLSALFRWRDKYPYGYIDTDGIGVDYPFLNGKHYPYENTIFRITPEAYNIPSDYATIGLVPPNITTIADPIVDECE
jgi:hypothetical protein